MTDENDPKAQQEQEREQENAVQAALQQHLRSLDGAEPNAESKKRHIAEALAAFTENNDKNNSETNIEKKSAADQGSPDATRPIEGNITDIRGSRTMNSSIPSTAIPSTTAPSTTVQRWAYSGMASAAVLVLAVGLIFTQVIHDPSMVPPAYEIPIDPNAAAKAGPNSERSPSQFDVQTKVSSTLSTQAASPESGSVVSQAELALNNDLQRLEEIVVTTADLAASAHESSAKSKMSQRSVPALSSYAMPSRDISQPVQQQYRDSFETFDANPVLRVQDNPVSTFSIDVDTAAYSFVRRQLRNGLLPQKSAVRLEEMVNYFDYDYPQPSSIDTPFEPTVSVMASPWNAENQLVHIGIKGYEANPADIPRSNIVFLMDVSGSMNQPDKLPLVKQSMSLLLSQLQPEDTVAIAVYAGAAGTVLEPTKVKDKRKIMNALHQLQAGGSTAGAQGIALAYELAEANYVENGVNRVFLATDGDFNVGMTNQQALQDLIERKRDSGIYLSVLGFGQGNYQDALMQKLAQNGNGIAAYIDTLGEAQKVLVEEARSQLFPIANDVKIQVEFNPATVSEYRLLGYETRALKQEDFNNDKVDAGEIGAGHTVTAIYEITPRGQTGLLGESRYAAMQAPAVTSDELGFLKIRYKKPGEKQSRLIERPMTNKMSQGSTEARFAVAVAGFAQLLTGGQYTADWRYEDALSLAMQNKGSDDYGYRAEFTQLVRAAMVAEDM